MLKSRDISLPIKVHISQGYGLPSAHIQLWEMDHKEGRAPKNWCLWTMVLEKTPESTLDNKRSNQSILRDITPEYLLEGLMLKLKLQYFGHFMRRVDSLEKTLMLGGIGDRRRRGWQRMILLDDITDSLDMRLGKLRELVMNRWAAVHGVAKSHTRPFYWIEMNWISHNTCKCNWKYIWQHKPNTYVSKIILTCFIY